VFSEKISVGIAEDHRQGKQKYDSRKVGLRLTERGGDLLLGGLGGGTMGC